MSENQVNQKRRGIPAWIGTGLILFGVVILMELQFHSGWLLYLPIFVSGGYMLFCGVKGKREGLTIAALMATSLCIGLFFLLSSAINWDVTVRLSGLFGAMAIGWFLVVLFCRVWFSRTYYWALFLGIVLAALGLCFGGSALRFLDFVLYVGLGLGFGMLIWGGARRLIGLLIPGSLLGSAALGVYLGWNQVTSEPNALARTGVMLVVFGLGWAMITLLSKRVYSTVLWWPLIPALVISVTGWGLYIGGNPSQAVRFIGNTGSVTLMILGVYVLLLRQGFHKE